MKKNAPRAKGLASILAISTANPENFIEQTTFPDFYFRATNTEHLVDLKKKFQRICDKTTIRKRHFTWNEQFLAANPSLIAFMANSFNIRQEISIREVPKLGAEVATKAINEWGQPKSRITHLIFCTTTVANLPGFDCQLVGTLGLNPNVERVMLYEQGCFGGGTTLRLAKCLAESRKGARVLVVCVETSAMIIRGPVEEHPEDLVTQALFADGASALIVGADPDEEAHERASFVIFSASQFLLPNSENAITACLSEGGFKVNIHRDVPNIISRNLGKCLEEAFTPLGILDWNSIFWVLHPGGRAIIDQIEERLGLKTEKLLTSRHVLAEYGNMISVSVLFVLDAMRKRSAKEGKSTSGEGFEWGVLFGFGPGITVETVVLKSVPL